MKLDLELGCKGELECQQVVEKCSAAIATMQVFFAVEYVRGSEEILGHRRKIMFCQKSK